MPEEQKAVFCEECGQEMDYFILSAIDNGFHKCQNPFCPAKFDGVEKEMAEKLVDVLDTVSTLEKRVKFLTRKITALEFLRDENE